MKMMNKVKFAIMISIVLLALTSCRQITEEEAIKITRDFVNTRVKFYVNEDNATPTVKKASITVADALKTEFLYDGRKIQSWEVYLNVKSEQSGELKQTNLLVIVDARKGDVLKWRKI